MSRTHLPLWLSFAFASGCRAPSNQPAPTAAGTIDLTGKPVEVVRTKGAVHGVEGVQRAFRVTLDTVAESNSKKEEPKRTVTVSALRAAEVDHFAAAGGGKNAVVAIPASRVSAPVVEIPLESDGALRVQSGAITVAATMVGVARKPAEFAQHIAVYADVGNETTLYRRVDRTGAEDFFHVTTARDHITHEYDVALTGVAGLRLVGGALELLDADGTPRLATTAPTVIDAKGVKRRGTLSVRGCKYDTNASEPWGRPVTAPGSDHCIVSYHIDAHGLAFPVLVDPAWFATGSHYQTHAFHKLLKLPSGKVLSVGGEGSAPSSTELFDPVTKTWASSTTVPEGLGEGTNAVVLSDGTVVIAGGYPSGSDTSTTIAAKGTTYVRAPSDGAWTLGPAMSSRAHHAMGVVTIGGKEVVLAAGGYPSSSASVVARATAEYFDPVAKTPWTTAASMATQRAKAAYTVLTDGRFLVAGGETRNAAGDDVDQSSAEIFDPATAKWVASGSLGKARSSAIAVAVAGGKAVIAGGWNEDGYSSGGDAALDSIEYFGGGTSWTLLTAKMTSKRQYFVGAALSDGRIVFAGGNTQDLKYSPEGTKTSDLLTLGATPATTAVVIGAGSMSDARMHAAAVSLGDTVLVSGGWDASVAGSESKTADLFDTTLGAACSSGASCPSGTFCTDGVCCKTAMCGTGETCAAPGFEGVCTKPKGAPCAASTECGSGFCVDGVCCDSACSTECTTCNAPGKAGTCTDAAAGTDPKKQCIFTGDDPSCAQTCNGLGACGDYVAEGTACTVGGDAGVDGGADGGSTFCNASKCDGLGACKTSAPTCGLSCVTDAVCDSVAMTCTPTALTSGSCAIEGACYMLGDVNPADGCKVCDTVSDPFHWTVTPGCTDGGVADTGAVDTGSVYDTGTLVDTGAAIDTGVSTPDTSVADSGHAVAELPEGQACSCDVPGQGSSSPFAAIGVAIGLGLIATRRRRS